MPTFRDPLAENCKLYEYLWGKDSTLRDRIYSFTNVPHIRDGDNSMLRMLSLRVGEEGLQDAVLQLPCGLTDLLVRGSYEGALRMMNDSEASRQLVTVDVEKTNDDGTTYTIRMPIPGTRQKVNRAFIFSGHPGIGKTCFLSYVLVERLLKAQPTVLQTGSDIDGYFHILFDQSGVRRVTSYDDDCLRDTAIWALTDQKPRGLASVFEAHKWLVVVTSSPRLENHKRIKKNHASPVYYMPEWTWEEIAATSSVPHQVSGVCVQSC